MKPRGKPFGGKRKFQRKGPSKPQAPATIPEEEEIGLLEQRIRDESPASGTQASRYLYLFYFMFEVDHPLPRFLHIAMEN